MRPLVAPERPVSHYRDGKLRSQPTGPAFGRAAGAAAQEGDSEQTLSARIRAHMLARQAGRADAADEGWQGAAQAAFRSRRSGGGESRDPAPSRLVYRVNRLWLTPNFRRFVRYGLPVLLIAAVVGGYAADPARRDGVRQIYADLRADFESRPEFMVKLMSIDGASEPVSNAIRALIPVTLPASSFALDLHALQQEIEKIDAVQEASLMVKAGGVLAVAVTERKPAVLWRNDRSLEMLDATGHRVATLLNRSARADLPVIAGQAADKHVPEALEILAAAQPILPRVRGLVRMGDRRWDIVLDRDQRILLPESDVILAVERLLATDGAEELLARDLSVVDLRNPDRPTLRLSPAAVAASRRLTETVTKVAGE
ncbi:MAG: cell division protein FtsQ/DivIB [Paracoccaceae bacterium]